MLSEHADNLILTDYFKLSFNLSLVAICLLKMHGDKYAQSGIRECNTQPTELMQPKLCHTKDSECCATTTLGEKT